MFQLSLRRAVCLIAFFMSGTTAFCQTDSLALSSGVTTPGSTVSLNLWLHAPSGSQPAGIQWTFAYSPSDIVAISATAGVSATAAGKSLLCEGSAGSYACFLTGLGSGGLNANIIKNGVVVVLTVTLSAATSSTTINVTNALSTSPTGSAIQTTGAGGTITATVTPSLTSLFCSPRVVAPSVSASCTVTLDQIASAGTSVTLSDTNALLTVPASVTVQAGANSATFIAAAGIFATDQSVRITAVLNGSAQSTNLGLVAAVISSLACNPKSVNSGAATTCAVTLSQAAPSGANVVRLSSNNRALNVPASVTVPSNTTSIKFTATVGAIATTQSATITATLNGASHSASLNLVAPALLSALTCNPATVNSSASSTCIVTLNQAAPPAGSTVTLSGNSTLLAIPASVAVAPGATSASFNVTAEKITTNQRVTVSASLNGGSQTVSLSLVAPVLVSALACNPGTIVPGNASICTVTLNQPAASAGNVVALSDNTSLLTIPATVTVPAGVTSITFTAGAGTTVTKLTANLTATLNGASQSAPLDVLPTPAISSFSCSPTSLTSGSIATCTVTLTRDVVASSRVQLNVNSPRLTIPKSLSVALGATAATFTTTAGEITTNQSAAITATLNTAGLNSSLTTTLNLSPVLPASLSCDATRLTAGASSTCTLTLTGPAPGGGVTVAVSSDGPALAAPPSVNIPALASTATFPVTAAWASPGGQSTVIVSAALFGGSQSASINVTICPCSVLSLSAQPANPDGNDNQAIEVGMQFAPSMPGFVTGVRFFKGLNNTGTHVGHLWSSKGKLLSSVTFTGETPSGWQTAYFPSPVAVNAHAIYLISYSAPNGNYAADSGSFTNALSSPPLVGLADGTNGPNGVYQYGSGQFPTSGAAATNFWVDVVFNTSPTIGTATPVSLWTPQATPNTPAAPTTQAAQLGLTFIPNTAGYITGLRFYKSPTNVGQHIGYLWSSTGTLLASVTFTDESASGWQQANFAAPIAVTANTAYVVSYWVPKGHYADDAGYFATTGLTNQLLYAPPDGQYGPNSSYAARNVFPAGSATASNYWVDVVFTTAVQ